MMSHTVRRRFAILFALLGTTAAWAHSGHMGDDLRLIITISDDGVRYDIGGFGQLFPGVPSDAQALYLNEEAAEYIFAAEEQQKRVTNDVFAAFADPNPVHIDGLLVKPVLEHFSMKPNSSPEAAAAPEIFPPEVSLVLHFPAKGSPKQVRMAWTVFMDQPQMLLTGEKPVMFFAQLRAFDQKKVLRFTNIEPEFVWHAPTAPPAEQISPAVVDAPPPKLAVPLVAVALALVGLISLVSMRFVKIGAPRLSLLGIAVALPLIGFTALAHVAVVEMKSPFASPPPLPDEQQAAQLFETLQRNVYRAFDYTKESDVYDVLVQSVDGPLLDQIYREVYESLIMREEGGAVAQVEKVDILDSALQSAGALPESDTIAFKIAAHWRVRGVVTHWGHAHQRINEYHATYTIAQRGERWKIVGVADVNQERVDPDDLTASLPASTKVGDS